MYRTSHIPSEWICNSKAYRRRCYMMGFMCGLIAYIFWTIGPTVEDTTKHSNFMFLVYALTGIAVFWFAYATIIIGNLKQVRFTPDYFYVGTKRIDFKHIRSVNFVKSLVDMPAPASHGLRFCIAFEPGSNQKENIYFSMKFHDKGWSLFADPGYYDFRSRFIDVIMALAAARKTVQNKNFDAARARQDDEDKSAGLISAAISAPESSARHSRPARLLKTSSTHKVPKEWVCNSKAYGRLFYVIGAMFFLVAFVSWATAQDPEFARRFPNSMIYAYLSAGVTAFCFWHGFSKTGHLKPVRFTPHFVFINRKKIDLKYIRSIYCVEAFRGRHGAVLGFHFCMTFEPNPVQQDDVHFSMEFYKGRWPITLNDHEFYDFRTEFIDVVMAWADERRKASTTEMHTFEHVPQDLYH